MVIAAGTILHLPTPLGDACPARKIPIQSSEWKTIQGRGFLDPTSHSMKLEYRPGDCFFTDDTTLAIQMSRDTKEDQMYSGAYYRTADLMTDGDYEVNSLDWWTLVLSHNLFRFIFI